MSITCRLDFGRRSLWTVLMERSHLQENEGDRIIIAYDRSLESSLWISDILLNLSLLNLILLIVIVLWNYRWIFIFVVYFINVCGWNWLRSRLIKWFGINVADPSVCIIISMVVVACLFKITLLHYTCTTLKTLTHFNQH